MLSKRIMFYALSAIGFILLAQLCTAHNLASDQLQTSILTTRVRNSYFQIWDAP